MCVHEHKHSVRTSITKDESPLILLKEKKLSPPALPQRALGTEHTYLLLHVMLV